jgi:hypothetical protein
MSKRADPAKLKQQETDEPYDRESQRGTQINIRVSEETRVWLEAQAGSKRGVPAYVRDLVERERAAQRERDLLAMFNRAALDLTDEDREERRLFMRAHPKRDRR